MTKVRDESAAITRRESLTTLGTVVAGVGLGVLSPTPAHAEASEAGEAKLVVHVYRRVGKQRRLVETLTVSPDFADKIADATDDPIELRVDEDDDDRKPARGRAVVAEAVKMKTALKRAKVKRARRRP